MMDDQMLTDALRKASTAEKVRVPPLARIVALAEYAKDVQRRRRFTMLIVSAWTLAAVCAGFAIFFAPHAFPLSLSPEITVLLLLGAVAAIWVITSAKDENVGGFARNTNDNRQTRP